MNIEVTLVSRRPERWRQTAAAVSVITADDLRRSGARSIPAALRAVPGMHIAAVDANKWVVTSRGFAGLFANKLLVLIDGRSVYTPLFSGVFWESQDVVLEDVERIEVIRGPGGSLWGANAVNGIINIVTKNAADTQGLWAQLGSGTKERLFATARHGGRLGERIHWRTYGKYFARGASPAATEQTVRDAWHASRVGGRLDWRLSERDALSLHGNVHAAKVGQSVALVTSLEPPYEQIVYAKAKVDGGAALGRWERNYGAHADIALQLYYDRYRRRDIGLEGTIHNADIDFQHRFRWTVRQELIWGLGYRFTTDQSDDSFGISFAPPSRAAHLFSGFVHDTIHLMPEQLRLMLGAKLEHNTYTAFEIQPNARLWWSPLERHSIWGAVSRAKRTPSRGESAMRMNTQVFAPGALFTDSPTALVVLQGSGDFGAEDILALELGYRNRQRDDLVLDLAGFYNLYDNLRTNELGLPAPVGDHLEIPLQIDNKATGRTYGFELSANYQALKQWRLRAAYTYLNVELEVEETSSDVVTETFAKENPRHQLYLHSSLEGPGRLDFDAIGRYVAALPTQNIANYLTLDMRLAWQLQDEVELALVGRNLLDSPHAEFISNASGSLPAEVEAEIYLVLNWNYRY